MTFPKSLPQFIALLNERKTNKQDTNKYDQNNHTFLRRMRLRRDSLRIHSRTGSDGALSLSRLPAIQRRSVFVVRHRAVERFQALAGLIPLLRLTQSCGWEDSSGLLP
jgi:hypothetical protein